jgi:hypothetical protein
LIPESEIINKQINFNETSLDIEIDEAIIHVDDLTFTYKENDYQKAINEEIDDSIQAEINDNSLYKSDKVDELNLNIDGNEIIRSLVRVISMFKFVMPLISMMTLSFY